LLNDDLISSRIYPPELITLYFDTCNLCDRRRYATGRNNYDDEDDDDDYVDNNNNNNNNIFTEENVPKFCSLYIISASRLHYK